MTEQVAVVVSGFPGVGKTTLFSKNEGLVLLDSDSSKFSWEDAANRVRHSEWPANYISHILENMNSADAIFVSSHQEVRDALVANDLAFVLVYPGLEMRDEYIQRYKDRGNKSFFVALLEENYEEWIQGLMEQQHCVHVVLKPGQYLSDVFTHILSAAEA